MDSLSIVLNMDSKPFTRKWFPIGKVHFARNGVSTHRQIRAERVYMNRAYLALGTRFVIIGIYLETVSDMYNYTDHIINVW